MRFKAKLLQGSTVKTIQIQDDEGEPRELIQFLRSGFMPKAREGMILIWTCKNEAWGTLSMNPKGKLFLTIAEEEHEGVTIPEAADLILSEAYPFPSELKLEFHQGFPKTLTAEAIKQGDLDGSLKDLQGLFPSIDELDPMFISWAGGNYKFIGQGTSRITYKVDKDNALKIALNRAGQAQNRVEAHLALVKGLPIAETHKVGFDDLYLLVEFANDLNEAEFKKQYKISFGDFCDFCDHFDREQIDQFPEKAQSLIHDLLKNNLVIEDIGRAEQWGSRVKNKEPILVDYGFDENVSKDHYN